MQLPWYFIFYFLLYIIILRVACCAVAAARLIGTQVNEIDESDLTSSSAQSSTNSLHSDASLEDASTSSAPAHAQKVTSPPVLSPGATTPPPQRSGQTITLQIQPENTPELSLAGKSLVIYFHIPVVIFTLFCPLLLPLFLYRNGFPQNQYASVCEGSLYCNTRKERTGHSRK